MRGDMGLAQFVGLERFLYVVLGAQTVGDGRSLRKSIG